MLASLFHSTWAITLSKIPKAIQALSLRVLSMAEVLCQGGMPSFWHIPLIQIYVPPPVDPTSSGSFPMYGLRVSACTLARSCSSFDISPTWIGPALPQEGSAEFWPLLWILWTGDEVGGRCWGKQGFYHACVSCDASAYSSRKGVRSVF